VQDSKSGLADSSNDTPHGLAATNEASSRDLDPANGTSALRRQVSQAYEALQLAFRVVLAYLLLLLAFRNQDRVFPCTASQSCLFAAEICLKFQGQHRHERAANKMAAPGEYDHLLKVHFDASFVSGLACLSAVLPLRPRPVTIDTRYSPLLFLSQLVLVGDTGVGKSSLLIRFTDGTFDDSQTATIGVDFKVR
jgi:hypothetical protein